MIAVLEYIMMNYTWLLVGTIIILLAIIGSYADSTNFGQGKSKEDQEKIKDLEFEKLRLEQQLEEYRRQQEINEQIETVPEENLTEEQTEFDSEANIEGKQLQTTSTIDIVTKGLQPNIEEPIEGSALDISEEKYAEFDKEFDELLPDKGFDDGDLLDDIENISLDKTQKIDITDIPDLDDVELPKIKSLAPVDEDIWKF